MKVDRMTHKQALAFKAGYFDPRKYGIEPGIAQIGAALRQLTMADRGGLIMRLTVPAQKS